MSECPLCGRPGLHAKVSFAWPETPQYPTQAEIMHICNNERCRVVQFSEIVRDLDAVLERLKSHYGGRRLKQFGGFVEERQPESEDKPERGAK